MGVFRALRATVLLCLALLVQPASADERGPFMTMGVATTQPIGHKRFCREHRKECRPAGTRGKAAALAPVELTTDVILSVATINTEVNLKVKAESDLTLYGVEEHWAYPHGAGDCEDYALMKRRLIHMADGVPLGNLLLTVVRKRDGEGHAVLTLRTTLGDFILDNLDWRIRSWRKAPYTFVKRQSASDPGQWIDIEDHGDILVGAVDR